MIKIRFPRLDRLTCIGVLGSSLKRDTDRHHYRSAYHAHRGRMTTDDDSDVGECLNVQMLFRTLTTSMKDNLVKFEDADVL